MKKVLFLFMVCLPLVALADAVEIDGIYYDLVTKAKVAKVTSGTTKYTGDIVIPASVVYEGVTYSVSAIDNSAFGNNSDLKSITIPNSITSIGNNAFEGCTNLANITIPNSVISIGSSAFCGCTILSSITIPNSVTSIGSSAFSGCTNLANITIPNSVTSIGSSVFSYCTSLTNITIPNSVTSIGGYAFQGCSGLNSVTIQDSVTSIGGYAFQGCSSLKSISIPNSVTSIGWYAFQGCCSLTSVIIGSNISSIGNLTFSDCENLSDVYCLAPTLPKTSSNAFNDSYVEYATLHVPTVAVELYKAGNGWKDFGTIVGLSDAEIDALTNCQIEASASYPFSTTYGVAPNIGGIELQHLNLTVQYPNTEPYTDNLKNLLSNGSWTINGDVKIVGDDGMMYYNITNASTIAADGAVKIANKFIDESGRPSSNVTQTLTIPLVNTRGDTYNYTFNFTMYRAESSTPDEGNNVTAVELCDPETLGSCSYTQYVTFTQAIEKSNVFPATEILGAKQFTFQEGKASVFGDSIIIRISPIDAVLTKDMIHLVSIDGTNLDNYVEAVKVRPYNDATNGIWQVVFNLKENVLGENLLSVSKTSSDSDKQYAVKISSSNASNGGVTSAYDLCMDVDEARYVYDFSILPASYDAPANVADVYNRYSLCEDGYTNTTNKAEKVWPIALDEQKGCYYSQPSTDASQGVNRPDVTADPWKDALDKGFAYNNSWGWTSTSYGNTNLLIDNRQKQQRLTVDVNEEITIEFPEYNIIKGFYVTLDNAFAIQSAPAESEAWNSYTYENVGTKTQQAYLFSGNKGTIKITSAAASGDIIGFRVHAVHLDGTLYDPDGRAFYVEVSQTAVPKTITFADANVKALCVANWDTDGDGELSTDEAAAVTDLGQVFQGNHSIKSFDELQYFTGLTSIADYVFGYNSLTSVTIPSNVTEIGSSAFFSCNKLTTVTMKNATPVNIGLYVFENRASTIIIVPEGSKEAYVAADYWKDCIIAEGAVNQGLEINGICYNLIDDGFKAMVVENTTSKYSGSITIPESVTYEGNTYQVISIGNSAFYRCSGLTSVTIPNGVTEIGGYAFFSCNRLTSVTIPNGVTVIGSAAFAECSDLTSVTIPNSVTSIGDNAFRECTSLISITIPNNVTEIGGYVFYECNKLTTVLVNHSTPVSISSDVFSNQANATLYVPAGSKAAYEAADYWKEFGAIVEYGTVEPTDISTLTDAIYINSFSARVGESATIEICLKNAEDATAYFFDLVLPEGITVAKNESGKYIDALSDRHDDHSRTFNYKGNNIYSLATLSGNSELLTDHDGTIRILTLEVADDMAEGSYVIEIKNASYSTPTGYDVMLPETKALITVEDYILGDVNGNDRIDIGDAVSIVNYLVGKESTKFVEKAADTNKNGRIDIGDAVTIVNVLVGKTTSFSRTIGTEQDEREPQ